MKARVAHLSTWLKDKVGFRRRPGFEGLHRRMRSLSAIFFEFLKRIALLSILWAAAQNTPWLQLLYFLGLAALIIPIGTWLEQWDLDFRTRHPTHYRPDLGEEPPMQIPIPADQPPAWSHSVFAGTLWTFAILLAVNWGIQSFVEAVATELSKHPG